MSKTPVVTSVDGNVSVASHWSNLPSRATDACTLNFIELSSFATAMIGTSAGGCAGIANGSAADATRQMTANRMESLPEHGDGDRTLTREAVASEDWIPLSKVTGHSLVQERWDWINHRRANR